MVNVKDLENQYCYREEDIKIANKNKFYLLLKYIHLFCKRNHVVYQEKENLVDCFFTNYFTLFKLGYYNDINLYMKHFGVKENSFIYELLHYRFDYEDLLPLKKQDNGHYILSFAKKKIEIANATDYFLNPNIREVFSRRLDGECFNRTLELLHCLKDSRAVVSYLPNIFVGGYYHAYIQCSDGVLIDPASNLVMINDDAKRLLDGDVIFSYDKEELNLALGRLSEIDDIFEYDRPQLLKLALYTECYELGKENVSNISRRGI